MEIPPLPPQIEERLESIGSHASIGANGLRAHIAERRADKAGSAIERAESNADFYDQLGSLALRSSVQPANRLPAGPATKNPFSALAASEKKVWQLLSHTDRLADATPDPVRPPRLPTIDLTGATRSQRRAAGAVQEKLDKQSDLAKDQLRKAKIFGNADVTPVRGKHRGFRGNLGLIQDSREEMIASGVDPAEANANPHLHLIKRPRSMRKNARKIGHTSVKLPTELDKVVRESDEKADKLTVKQDELRDKASKYRQNQNEIRARLAARHRT